LETTEILIGIAEIAVALAGFSGVVVVFGSRNAGAWHPGDRLRLSFLIESSLTAAGFSLLALLGLFFFPDNSSVAWMITSALWAAFMCGSLYSSHRRIGKNLEKHDDIDKTMNRVVTLMFALLVILQIANAYSLQSFAPLLAALCANLAGAAMQFARLITSAFHD
jgi:hypothetical protein